MTELSSYDPSAPLLLVSAFAPGMQGGGAVILRSLLKGFEANVVWASLDPEDAGYDGAVAHIQTRSSPWLVPPGALARRIEALADEHSATAIWAVAHGPLVPCLAALAADSTRRLHISVHDDPAWAAALRSRRERPLVPWLHVQFGRALAEAASLDAIGGGMRAAIARRSGRASVVVHRVVDGPVAANTVRAETDRLTIGLLGSVYVPRQLEQLTAMLAATAGLIGRPTRLVVIGGLSERMRRAVSNADVEVDLVGHLAEPEGVELLRGAFALYLGYPFGPWDRALRRTSFAAKLATYVQAARPLLVHAPYDSSLTPLFGLSFTIPWVDQSVQHGARLLARAWLEGGLLGSQHDDAETVRQAYFGEDNRARLFEALNALVGS